MTDLTTENARLRAALAYYADQFCEGFCNDLPEAGTYHISMDDRCSGCKARAALATPAPDAPDLTDPVVVHANMLRGTIAKPSVAQIIHLYGSAVFLELLYKRGLCKPTAPDAVPIEAGPDTHVERLRSMQIVYRKMEVIAASEMSDRVKTAINSILLGIIKDIENDLFRM